MKRSRYKKGNKEIENKLKIIRKGKGEEREQNERRKKVPTQKRFQSTTIYIPLIILQ